MAVLYNGVSEQLLVIAENGVVVCFAVVIQVNGQKAGGLGGVGVEEMSLVIGAFRIGDGKSVFLDDVRIVRDQTKPFFLWNWGVYRDIYAGGCGEELVLELKAILGAF